MTEPKRVTAKVKYVDRESRVTAIHQIIENLLQSTVGRECLTPKVEYKGASERHCGKCAVCSLCIDIITAHAKLKRILKEMGIPRVERRGKR